MAGMLQRARAMRDEMGKRKRRAYEANQQAVVRGGAGAGRGQRAGMVSGMDARALRRQLNEAVARKDAAQLRNIQGRAQRWLDGGVAKGDRTEVSNILNTAKRMIAKYGGS